MTNEGMVQTFETVHTVQIYIILLGYTSVGVQGSTLTSRSEVGVRS